MALGQHTLVILRFLVAFSKDSLKFLRESQSVQVAYKTVKSIKQQVPYKAATLNAM